MSGELDLSPSSRSPRDARERDLLLRRVPEVALLPELTSARFDAEQLSRAGSTEPALRIAELADAAYLGRLRAALTELVDRAARESNRGLSFLATSLLHFVGLLPSERHPLVVALYFLSSSRAGAEPDVEALAREMDEYESTLDTHAPSR